MKKEDSSENKVVPFVLSVLTAIVKFAQAHIDVQEIKIRERIDSGEPPEIVILPLLYDSEEERLSIVEEQEAIKIIAGVNQVINDCIAEIAVISGIDLEKALAGRSISILTKVYMIQWMPNSSRIKSKVASGLYYFPDIYKLFTSYSLYELGYFIEHDKIDNDGRIEYIDGPQWTAELLRYSRSEKFSLFRLGQTGLFIGGTQIVE